MKKISILTLLAAQTVAVFIGCKPGENNGTSKTDSTTSATTTTNTPKPKPLIDGEQPLVFSLYVANSAQGRRNNAIPANALTTANACIVIGNDQIVTQGQKCFLVVNATVAGTVMTITPGSVVYEQDASGNCPDNCDINDVADSYTALLDCDYPYAPVLYNNFTAPVNNTVNNFVTNHNGDYNVLQINTGKMTQLFQENPNVTSVLIQITLAAGGNTVTYQAWQNAPNTHLQDYTDNAPRLYMNAQVPVK